MKRILCGWLPHWSLQHLRATRPEHRGRAVVLYLPDTAGSPVRSMSRQAAARGVRAGMPLAEARARVDPDTVFLPADLAAERAALGRLAVWCRRFSPLVGVEDGDRPEALLLNVSGCAAGSGGEPALASRVRQELRERRLQVRVAVADTPGAAWAVAHFGPREVAVVPPGRQRQALLDLPIEALRLPGEVVHQLHQLDVRRIGAVLALPRSSLPARFGPRLLQRIDQALGAVPEPIRLEAVSEPVEAAWSGDDPLADRRGVEEVVRRLLAEVVARLEEQGQGVGRLTCVLEDERAELARVEVQLLQATRSGPRLEELLRLRLQGVSVAAEVWRVRLRVEPAALEAEQQTFLEEADPAGPRELAALTEQLTSRLGPAAVLRPRLTEEAQPELAVRYEPAVAADRRAGRPAVAVDPRGPYRPLYMEPEPEPVAVAAPAGPPLSFCWQGRHYPVARCWGPERIETGWWRQRDVRRDYYRVETETGERFWLFCRLDDRRWFLHGRFE